MNIRTAVHREKVRRGIPHKANAAAIGLLLRGASALYKSARLAKSPAVRAKAIKAAAAAYRVASSAMAKIAKMIRGAGAKSGTLAKKLGPQRKKLARIKRTQYTRIHSLIDKKKNPAEYAKVRKLMGIRKPRAGIRKAPKVSKLPPPAPKAPVPPPVPKSPVPPPQPKTPAPPPQPKQVPKSSKLKKAADVARRAANVPGAGMVGGIVGEMVAEKAIEKALSPKKSKPKQEQDTEEASMRIIAKVALTTRIKTKTTKLLNSIGAEITKQKKRSTRLMNQLDALNTECKKVMQKGGAKAPKLLAELRNSITQTHEKYAKESAVLRRLQVQHAQLLKQADLNQNAV